MRTARKNATASNEVTTATENGLHPLNNEPTVSKEAIKANAAASQGPVMKTATLPFYEKGTLYNLEVASLVASPDNPRSDISDSHLLELARSIDMHGVLQPVLFNCDSNNRLVVVAGARRLEASRLAGTNSIPGVFVGEEDSAAIALVENIMRQDLTPIQQAEALHKLQAQKGYSLTGLALIIGKAKSTLSEYLSLNDLPADIRDKFRNDHDVPARKLLELAKAVGNPEKFQYLKDKLLNNASRDELRAARSPEPAKKNDLSKWMDTGLNKIVNANFTDVDNDKKPEITKKIKALIEHLQKKLVELES